MLSTELCTHSTATTCICRHRWHCPHDNRLQYTTWVQDTHLNGPLEGVFADLASEQVADLEDSRGRRHVGSRERMRPQVRRQNTRGVAGTGVLLAKV